MRSVHLAITLAVLAAGAAESAVVVQSLGPDGARIDGFAQAASDPDRFYCLPHRQGVSRSEDAGDTWTRADVGLPKDRLLRGLAVSPVDEGLLIVGDPAADRLLRSTDAGVTWTAVAIAAPWDSLEVQFDPHDGSRVLAALARGAARGVYRSTDAGLTWVPSGAGLGALSPRFLAFHPGTPGIVLLVADTGLFRSTDAGASWTTLRTGYHTGVTYCEGTPDRAWVLASSASTGEPIVLRSDDGGATFAETDPVPGLTSSDMLLGVAAHPTNPAVALVGTLAWVCIGDCSAGLGPIYRTTDGGATWAWTSFAPHGDWRGDERFTALRFDSADPARIWVAASCAGSSVPRYGLQRSTDGGGTFAPHAAGIHGQPIVAVDRDGAGAVYVHRRGSGTWRSAAVGAAWEPRSDAFVSNMTCFEANHATAGVLLEAGYSASMDTAEPQWSISTDGGVSWVGDWIPPTELFEIPSVFRSNHGAAGRIYLWTDRMGDAALHRSDGQFSFVSTVPSFLARGAAIDPADDERLFALDADTGEVKLSTDAGTTWVTRSAGLPGATPVDFFMDPGNADRLAAVYRTAGAYRSDDGGLTWAAAPVTVGASPVVAADWDASLDRFAIATQGEGVFVTGLGLLDEELPTLVFHDVTFEPASGTVLLATAYRSVLAIDAPDPTGVPVVAMDAGLDLRVAPNPFREGVRIRLAAPAGAAASVEIFAVDGRRVASIPSPAASAGERTLTWDGRDAAGREVAAGVYFVRAAVDGRTGARRVVRLDR